MQHQLLHHIYQAWQQGNQDYVLDWNEFVIYAARHANMPYDEMLVLLKTYKWFQFPDD